MSTKRCKRRRSFVALFALASAAVPPSPARAQGTDQAAARTLFNEGRDLLKAGDYAAACPRLEAAAALYPGPGVLLNLGDCYEHTHRTASAWAEFSAAEAASSRAGREDTALEASHRKQAAEQRLCRLLIRSASRQAGLSIERDHVRVDAGAWGMAIPVDPGEHLVAAAAPGRLPGPSPSGRTSQGRWSWWTYPRCSPSPVTGPEHNVRLDGEPGRGCRDVRCRSARGGCRRGTGDRGKGTRKSGRRRDVSGSTR